MTAAAALLRLRRQEVARTWRIAVLPAVTVVLAVAGPLLARFANDLLAAALTDQTGGSITLPPPTATDAYAQWAKNLTQIVILVALVMAAGAINTEIRNGFAALLIVKPAGRTAYVVTQAATLIGFTAVTAFLGAGVTWLITLAVFGTADAGAVLGTTAVWLVLAALLVCAALLASATIDSAAGAAGVAIGSLFALALLGTVPALAEYTPAGLPGVVAAVAAGTPPAGAALWSPVLGGLLLAAMLLAVTAAAFHRREL